MSTPRERALERLTKIAPHLPNAGTVVNELVAAYEVVEAAASWFGDEGEDDLESVKAVQAALARFDEVTVTG